MSSVAFEGEEMPAPRQGLWLSGPVPAATGPRTPHTIVCFLTGRSMDLQDRSILPTGPGGGSGAALALQLAARSVRLKLVSRRRGPLDEVAAAVRERGGEDPARVDRTLLARKGALEEALAGHSSL